MQKEKSSQIQRTSGRVHLLWLAAVALQLLSIVALFGPRWGLFDHTAKPKPQFSWRKLKPDSTLQWAHCYTGMQCARLDVPLDYHDPENKERAAIALLKIPSKYKDNDPKYKGPILFNPGGPGGSGVYFIRFLGNLLQQLLGDEFDIIGFDPRGIGYTSPGVDMFPDDPLKRTAWLLRIMDAPLMNQTSNSLSEIRVKWAVVNDLMASRTPKSIEYANTAVVSRDMLSITQAHGRDKLLYWGFSYGSVLGTSYAALFPDNVGRVIVDGVVDVPNYYKGLWSNNLKVADKGLQSVFEECSTSPEDCPLHEPTADLVKKRLEKIIDSLEQNPVPVKNGDDIGIITKKQAQLLLFQTMYSPYQAIKPFFAALRALESGDGLLFHQMSGEKLAMKIPCDCGSFHDPEFGGVEAGNAIKCVDGEPIDESPEGLQRHFEKLANVSYFGAIWSEIKMECVGWKIKPKWEWRGPVTGNTSFPLLFVGNTEDPVTPFAEKMSKEFPGSVVLTQKSAGHCSLAATSWCTANAIRSYFRDGIFPAKGTLCDIQDSFFNKGNETELVSTMSVEEVNRFEALKELTSKARFEFGRGFH